MKETVERRLGMHLTERKIKDFDKEASRFGEFIHVSQFVNPQPTHISQVDGDLTSESRLHTGSFMYGIEQDGTLTWLGEIIDSSD